MNFYLPVWKFILEQLAADRAVMLLLVTESSGSSPGRLGFKMAVSADGICGSIGGGVMEVKIVEHAKSLLDDPTKTVIKHQVHRKDVGHHQSGMICSGEQTVVYFKINSSDASSIEKLISCAINYHTVSILISHENGNTVFNIEGEKRNTNKSFFEKINETDFRYRENTGFQYQLFIVGGGHCALALSELMSKFDFYITVIDDRPGLNTIHQNTFAQRIHILEVFDSVDQVVPAAPDVYVVIMTLGYRTDLIALEKLIGRNCAYMGLLGSKSKVEKLLYELEAGGHSKKLIQTIHAPIGIDIQSHTPEEIAVSIAAEIIRHKNQKNG
ncbi:MAG: XdhC family protein [Bacteroidota bacterium]|nr:XdhC family protein [Bacteroidota bacterium]